MTLQSSIKRPPIAIIDAPGIIIVLAIVWLVIEDLFKVSKPLLITAGQEIKLTIENDPACLDIRQAWGLFPIASAFTVFYVLFLMIEIWS